MLLGKESSLDLLLHNFGPFLIPKKSSFPPFASTTAYSPPAQDQCHPPDTHSQTKELVRIIISLQIKDKKVNLIQISSQIMFTVQPREVSHQHGEVDVGQQHRTKPVLPGLVQSNCKNTA